MAGGFTDVNVCGTAPVLEENSVCCADFQQMQRNGGGEGSSLPPLPPPPPSFDGTPSYPLQGHYAAVRRVPTIAEQEKERRNKGGEVTAGGTADGTDDDEGGGEYGTTAKYGFTTRAVHEGQTVEAATGAVMPPLFLTTTYAQKAPAEHRGYDYTRGGNPSFAALEYQVAALEGGRFAVAMASGLSCFTALLSTLRPGDEVVAFSSCYGGTFRLLRKVFEPKAIKPLVVAVHDWTTLESIAEKEKERRARCGGGGSDGGGVKMCIIESPTNPLLEVIDIPRLCGILHSAGITVVVDNTFASPFHQNPLELGCDAVVHSSSKYLGGHTDIIGGVVITNDDKLAEQVGFHRMSMGLQPSPFDCWLLSRSLKTLSLRMVRHSSNAVKVAKFLLGHVLVSKVYYPGLEWGDEDDATARAASTGAAALRSVAAGKELMREEDVMLSEHRKLQSYHHEVARRQMKNGFGGMVSAEFRLSFDETKDLISSFKLFLLAESLGGVESLVDHPASMTHASIPPEERKKIGLSDGLVRFSVGIEEPEDLIADLRTALRRLEKRRILR